MFFTHIRHFEGLFIALFLCSFFVSCVGAPPVLERAKAYTARDYAQKNSALKYSPKTYRRGEYFFKQAQRFYEERIYKKAEAAYIQSRRYFEKAENHSRLKQAKDGGGF